MKRDLRREAIKAVIVKLKNNKWAYFTAPTGFGKTKIMIEIGNAFPGTKVMLCNVSDQPSTLANF